MIQEVPYGGWERNLRLDDGEAELVVTLDVGPRILFAAPKGGRNLFAEVIDHLGKCGEKEWKIRGGHRFWTAPENEATYAPDNEPISYTAIPDGFSIASPPSEHGWQKTLSLVSTGKGRFTVTHTLHNHAAEPIAVCPWALSVMAPGGTAILPQPAPKLHPNDLPPGTPFTTDDFQANRRIVLWKYTHLNDPRFRLEPAYWFISQHVQPETKAAKFGLRFREGWVAYQLGNAFFAKTVPEAPGADYPDDGSNFELYTDKGILELETLAPLGVIPPGESRTHVETWKIGKWDEPVTSVEAADRFFAMVRG
jgi:hypothetical protein